LRLEMCRRWSRTSHTCNMQHAVTLLFGTPSYTHTFYVCIYRIHSNIRWKFFSWHISLNSGGWGVVLQSHTKFQEQGECFCFHNTVNICSGSVVQ
jgi:hypothetical protein